MLGNAASEAKSAWCNWKDALGASWEDPEMPLNVLPGHCGHRGYGEDTGPALSPLLSSTISKCQ